jgi:MarR family transcriptional regulator, organic hydroperoxide resistance regulator
MLLLEGATLMRRLDPESTAAESMVYREKPAAGSDTLVDLLARANHLLTERLYQQVRWQGISASEWRVLAALSARDGIAMNELADLVLFKQPTLTKAIDRMERAELVERRTPTTDRRRTLVHLTERGRCAAAPLLQRAQRHAVAIERLLGETKSRELKGALASLIARLGELPHEPRASMARLPANDDAD